MKPKLTAVRAGLRRGRIELVQTFTNLQDLWAYFFPVVALITVTLFLRGSSVPGTNFSLGTRTLPSGLGMTIAFGGLITVAQHLIVEREDGTLLRAKAVPNGMLGYLVGKVTLIVGMSLASLVLQVTPGLFVLSGLVVKGAGGLLTLAAIVVLGLVATMPIGAVIGSMFSSPRSLGLVMLPLMALIGTSGIFYPINNFPGWLRAVAQVFPVYWLGLGMRSTLLPDALAQVELGHSWRHLATFGVLGAWAVAGMVVAPIVLRRMARLESGSSMASRRQKAMQRAI
jgi:ABC-2 type transport system permease protein